MRQATATPKWQKPLQRYGGNHMWALGPFIVDWRFPKRKCMAMASLWCRLAQSPRRGCGIETMPPGSEFRLAVGGKVVMNDVGAHLESSVLHVNNVLSVFTDTVFSDWGLSMLGRAAQRRTGDRNTKSREDKRLIDDFGIRGKGGKGERKVLLFLLPIRLAGNSVWGGDRPGYCTLVPPPPPVSRNQQCLTAEPGVGSCAHFPP